MADTTTWNRTAAQSSLIDYISEHLVGGRLDRPLGPDDDLLASGLVDSLGVMRLIQFVEEEYGLSVPPEDVTIENFMTVATLAGYLETLGGSAGG